MKRRHFLRFIGAAAGTVGGLAIGWSFIPPRQRLTPGRQLAVNPGQVALNGWVKVAADDSVSIVMTQAELGQGIHTTCAMLLADEMDAAWDRVRLEQSTLDRIYNNQAEIVDNLPFAPEDNGNGKRFARWMAAKVIREVPGALGTGGSSSVTDLWLVMREAGASARAALIASAADTWKVPASECRAESSRVIHTASNKTASFGELAAHAAQLGVPRNIALKDPAQFKLIGKPVRRFENKSKITGAPIYTIDQTPPGLLYASINLCPTVGGKVLSFDDSTAKSLPGVYKIVAVAPYEGGLASHGPGTGGVAVIADSPWHAITALAKIKVQWDHGQASTLSSKSAIDDMAKALDAGKGSVRLARGNVDTAFQSAAKTITAEYRVPYLAHATMEPMNCTVQFKNGHATVWAPAQGPAFAANAAASVLGIKAGNVKLVIPMIGGGFGRRTFVDVVSQAAALAKETNGAPVQLLWSREMDMTHDYYRPAFVSRNKAAFDAQGKLIAWQAATAGSSMGAPSVADGSSKGAADTGYAFPAAHVTHTNSDCLIPVGIWRSVGHSYNAFFTESFIDEAAHAANADPLAFRADLLAHYPRMLRVLKRAAEISNWGRPLDAGRAQGIAIHQCFGSVIANVAEVSVDDAKKIRVHKVHAVLDCGFPVNPNLIRQQIEGGIVFGLSAVLQGEINVENGQVKQNNFDTYAPLRMRECPVIEVDIIDSQEHPGGLGETGVPTVMPAVANAVFALTGQRLRTLPLRLS